jgi:hypothetical protein
MMIADAIAQTAWNATREFKGETLPDRLRLMLEFLIINHVETLTDDDQAAVIRSCRKLATDLPSTLKVYEIREVQ